MPSSSFTSSEKSLIKSVLTSSSCKIITATLARIYVTYPTPDRWYYTGIEGALAFVRDADGNFGFRVVDLKNNGKVIWDHELYDDFYFYQDKPYFHTFAGDVRLSTHPGMHDRTVLRGRGGCSAAVQETQQPRKIRYVASLTQRNPPRARPDSASRKSSPASSTGPRAPARKKSAPQRPAHRHSRSPTSPSGTGSWISSEAWASRNPISKTTRDSSATFWDSVPTATHRGSRRQ